MAVYKDTIPGNANILVDYTVSDKGTVKFSYPLEWTYWKAVWKRGKGTFINTMLGVTMYPLIFLLVTAYKYLPFMDFVKFWFAVVYFVVGVPIIVNYVLALHKEHYLWVIPKLNYYNARYLFSKVKEKVFTAEDVKHDKRSYYVEIPHFSNIFLRYDAKGSMASKLRSVEVQSHDFSYYKISIFGKKTREKTDFDFSARFNLEDDIQLDGEIEVRFA